MHKCLIFYREACLFSNSSPRFDSYQIEARSAKRSFASNKEIFYILNLKFYTYFVRFLFLLEKAASGFFVILLDLRNQLAEKMLYWLNDKKSAVKHVVSARLEENEDKEER